MADSLRQLIAEIQVLWNRIGLNQKIAMSVVITAIVAALAFWGSWNSTTDYGLLFKNLQHKDAGEIINVLKADGIPYRVEDNGTTVLVPDGQVYDLRVELATQGLPGEEKGWSLFDDSNFIGLSSDMLRINHTRALQAELQRTINRFRHIEWSRVHIVEEEESLFVDDKEAATASVMIKTRGGARLEDSQIAGITHLIAGAVRGLTPDHVTITDYSGRQLSDPSDGSTASLASSQLDYQRRMEERLSSKATKMLEQAVGPGRAVVTVSADIDFTSSESREFTYKDQIIQRKEEIISETTAAGDGAPTLNSVREESTDYGDPVLSIDARKVDPAGKIERLTAAVFVSAGEYKTSEGPDGEQVRKYVSATSQQIKEYEQIVKNAIGFDDVTRTDLITISDGEFRSAVALPAEELKMVESQQQREFIIGLAKSGSTAFGLLVFLVFARRTLKKAFGQKPAQADRTGTATAPVGTVATAPAAVAEGPPEPATAPLKELVASAVNEDPERATHHLRSWLSS